MMRVGTNDDWPILWSRIVVHNTKLLIPESMKLDSILDEEESCWLHTQGIVVEILALEIQAKE